MCSIFFLFPGFSSPILLKFSLSSLSYDWAFDISGFHIFPSFRKHWSFAWILSSTSRFAPHFFRPAMQQLTTPKLGLTIYNVTKLAWQQLYNIISALFFWQAVSWPCLLSKISAESWKSLTKDLQCKNLALKAERLRIIIWRTGANIELTGVMSRWFCCFLDQTSQYNSLLSLVVGKIPLRTHGEDPG